MCFYLRYRFVVPMSKGAHRLFLYRGRELTNNDRIIRNKNLPTIIIDETGGIDLLASDEERKRSHFTVVGTLVTDTKRFKGTMDEFPHKNSELKYSSATLKERKPVFECLAAQDFTFSEVHKSRRNECFKSKKAQVKTYMDMVSEVLETNYPECPCDVMIDSPPVAALAELKQLCMNLIEGGNEIELFSVCPSSDEWSLQVHDFITGAVGDNVEGIKDRGNFYSMIEGKHRK